MTQAATNAEHSVSMERNTSETDKRTIVGSLTSGAFSPNFKSNIGLGMVNDGYWDNNKKILVNIADQEFREGLIKDLPLIQ